MCGGGRLRGAAAATVAQTADGGLQAAADMTNHAETGQRRGSQAAASAPDIQAMLNDVIIVVQNSMRAGTYYLTTSTFTF